MFYSGKQKIIVFTLSIIKFRHMFFHSAQAHGALLELKNSSILLIFIKKWAKC